MRLNNNLLKQQGNMVMIKDIIYNSELKLMTTLKIDSFWIHNTNTDSRLWLLLEGMGQTAELFWRMKNINGKGYLIKIDKCVLNYSENSISNNSFDDISVEVMEKMHFSNYYVSEACIKNKDIMIIKAEITHCFMNE